MVTKEQAMHETRFHFVEGCRQRQSGRSTKHEIWRKNGQTKTWKTRPNEFRVPVKFGIRDYSYIDEANADLFCVDAECPWNEADNG